MPPKRMTANPVRPARYRPGKPVAESQSSSENESDALEEEDAEEVPPKSVAPPDSTRIASNLKKVDLNARRRQAAIEESKRLEAERIRKAEEEEGFETEDSEEASDSGSSGSQETSSEAESSSDSDAQPKRVLLRPTFIKKGARKESSIPLVASSTADLHNDAEIQAEEEARRRLAADELIQEQLDKQAAAKAAGKKYWDDDDDPDALIPDDTDGLDPEAELAAWKLRELHRVKRERTAIEEAEKEREEIERRRNLSTAEREAEDRAFLEGQREEREDKGKMGFMQKYFHKGAFFQEDAKEQGLDRRDIMGSRYADDVRDREALPEYMQIRDMAKLGRKGRTKYRDMRTEDTGRFGEDTRKAMFRGDERFRPDGTRGGGGASGANATVVKERERGPPSGAPKGPRGRDDGSKEERKKDSYVPDSRRRSSSRDRRDRSDKMARSRDEKGRGADRRRDSLTPDTESRSRSRDRGKRRERRRYSRSKSIESSRDRRDSYYERDRRKRSPSPSRDRYRDKRQRV